MEAKTLIFFFLLFLISLRFLMGRLKWKPNLPPSLAWALPVIGHLHLLKPPLHRTFLSISKSLSDAPIFSIRLGKRLVFVVSSHSIAEECFTKNDFVQANRPDFIIFKHVGYNHRDMISASYGDLWRNTRRIAAAEIFSTHRLNRFLPIRQDEIRWLLVRLYRNFSQKFAKVEMKSMLFELTFNNIMRMVAGKRYYTDKIDKNIGLKRLMEESDIPNLIYLQNIVLETLRLYPAAPLLVPHVASEDCKVGEYDMPRGTMLLANVWAIHRDPHIWNDPTSFKPERFEKDGEDQKLMAFGLGRRACPGSGLAQRLVCLTLGSLIQCFEWKRVGEEKVDMSEGKGLTMPKAKPLESMCRTRSFVGEILHGSA